MVRSKLLTSLSNCSHAELRRFDDFISSPYFNKKKSVSLLWETLRQAIRNRRKTKTIPLLQSVGESLQLDDTQLRNRLSELSKLYMKFLAIENLQKREACLQLYGLQQARDIGDLLFLEFKGNQLRNQLQEDTLNSQDLEDSFKFYRLQADADLKFYRSKPPGNLITACRLFETYTAMERLKLLNKLYFYQTQNSTYIPVDIEEECHELIAVLGAKEEFREQSNLLNLYFHALNVQVNLVGTSFDILYQAIEQQHEIAMEDFSLLLTVAKNYCINRINHQKANFGTVYDDLLEAQIAKKMHLDEWSINNLVLISCRAGKVKRALMFLERWKNDLPIERRESVYQYNLATILNYQGRSIDAIQLLDKIDYSDTAYFMGAKYKMVKIYYELNSYQLIPPILDSFRVYILRHKGINSVKRKGGLNFVKLTQHLIRLKMDKDYLSERKYSQKMRSLHARVKEEELLVNKDWLMQETNL